MTSGRYSRSEILTISALVGLLIFSIFATAGTQNSTSASETSMYSEQVGGLYGMAETSIEYVPQTDKGPSDIYVRFEGVNGEVEDADHEDWCEVIAFEQAHSMQLADTDSIRGKPSPLFDDIRIVKIIDKASPKLAEAVCMGSVFPTVEIHVTASDLGSGRSTYLAYELGNVLATSYAFGGAAQSEDVPCEEVTLSFEEIKMTYTEFDTTGKPKGNVEYSWTLK